jgi:hypothetical protein
MLQILTFPNWEELLLSIIQRDVSYYKLPNFLQSYIKMRTVRFLVRLNEFFDNLLNKVDEDTRESILNCLNAINEQLSKYDLSSISPRREFFIDKFPFFNNPMFQNLPQDQLDIAKIQKKILEAKKKVPSRCTFCGKIIPKDEDVCKWCGHKKDDDDKDGFAPNPFIFKPPGGGGGSMKSVAKVNIKSKA